MLTTYTYPPKKIMAAEEGEDDANNVVLLGNEKRKPYSQYDYTFEAKHSHFYLSEEVGEPRLYADMIHRISAATTNDTIFIHLNIPGGSVATGVQIINAMQTSQAKIVTILESEAYSLGTLILLAGDEILVNDNCLIMLHNFSGGVIGKGNEQMAQLDATIKWFTTLAKKIYVPFLTEDEFQRITKGEDLWMQSPEIRKRLDRMMKAEDEPKKTKKPKLDVEDESLPDTKPPKKARKPRVSKTTG